MLRRVTPRVAAPTWAARRWQGGTPGKVKVNFVLRGGKTATYAGSVGATVMEVARDNGVDMEAACDGTCSCSTCHVYIDAAAFKKLPAITDDEQDMLDLADDPKEGASRLACQLKLTPELDGMTATLPASVANQLS